VETVRIAYIITLFIIGIFIASCTPQEEICPVEGCGTNVETPPVPETPPLVETPPVVETTPPPIEPTLPPEISTLFDKAKTKTSYQYKYQGPPNTKDIYEVFVKGDKMKVYIPKASSSIRTLNYDTVYIDLSTMTAKGYCEWNNAYCTKTEGVTAPAEDFAFKTPFQWIDGITTGTIKGSETFDKRAVYHLEYFVDGVRTNVLIDKFTGVPVQVLIGEDPRDLVETRTIYTYSEFVANSLQDADFVHKETP
jgi:hypothetical protein